MQPGCDEIEFLISKSVDGEATSEERALVDHHVAGCDSCAYKLTSYMEMAAIFSSAPHHVPNPQVRSGVFTEIHRIKEAEAWRQEAHSSRSRPRITPIPGRSFQTVPQREASLGSRLWNLGSPFAVMGTVVAALLVIMTIAVPPALVEPPIKVASAASPIIPRGVNTRSISSIQHVLPDGIPSPVSTHLVSSTRLSSSATVRSTATFVRDRVLDLAEPTAVREIGDPNKLSNWHLVRDPAYGYTISYPPNWWTQVRGTTRYFYPWGPGGVRYAPYWIELRVQDNPHGYTAETANDAMFGGACSLETGSRGGTKYLRRSSSDGDTGAYDDLYVFDSAHIYTLRLKVPLDSSLGNFQMHFQESQLFFSRMSGSLSLAPGETHRAAGYGLTVFLNGTDLWVVNTGLPGARPLTRGYVVKQFAVSADLRHVAFTATNDPNDKWADAKYLYVLDSEAEGPPAPRLLASGLSFNDIAWYSDHAMIAIAKREGEALGVYRIDFRLANGNGNDTGIIDTAPQLLTMLSTGMTGARGLAISPDRQLITFIAPLGELKGTDIYAMRPDGSDLRKIVSHTDSLPPSLPTPTGGEYALTRESQAIKSYTWLDGRLEDGKYYLDLLFTCGTNSSPTRHRGGFLYSAQGAARGTLLQPLRLDVADAEQVRIVHVAYSPHGKVALTGYYDLRDERVDVLAGLWTADIINGNLVNLKAQPIPASPNGIADLQWSPDGHDLIYRETVRRKDSDMMSRYEGDLEFKMMRLEPETGDIVALYDTTGR